MRDNQNLKLRDVLDVKELALTARKRIGVYEDFPIGNDLRHILEDEKIIICEYPFENANESHTDATITIFDTSFGELTFIGLNSSLYYDEQIFALAHEYYHYLTRTGKAYQYIDKDELLTEQKADRFAAEFILPSNALMKRVIKDFNAERICDDVPWLRLLRFIASIHITWWLPYRSIVRRMHEEGIISKSLYEKLYIVDCRDCNEEYARIFRNLDEEIFTLLNTKSKVVRISKQAIMVTISNFEDGYISEDDLVALLETFGKKPSDFGYQIIADEDEDLNSIFGDVTADEG